MEMQVVCLQGPLKWVRYNHLLLSTMKAKEGPPTWTTQVTVRRWENNYHAESYPKAQIPWPT